jgi:hypothetical protein
MPKFFSGMPEGRSQHRGRAGPPQDTDIFGAIRDAAYTPSSVVRRSPRTPTRVSRSTPHAHMAPPAGHPRGGDEGMQQWEPATETPPQPHQQQQLRYATPTTHHAIPSSSSYLARPNTQNARTQQLGDGSPPSWWAGGGGGGTVRVFRQGFALEESMELHAFSWREALSCV